MHNFSKVFFIVLCAIFSAPIQADDFVSVVEKNFPYQEVKESYGVATIQEGRCQEGTPFQIAPKTSRSGAKMDLAKRIHEKLRSLSANAFLIADLKEGSLAKSITVTPLVCDLG